MAKAPRTDIKEVWTEYKKSKSEALRNVLMENYLPTIFRLPDAGRFFGPLLGAAISVLLPEWLRFSEGLYLMIYAVLVMLLLAFCPSGLLGLGALFRKRETP